MSENYEEEFERDVVVVPVAAFGLPCRVSTLVEHLPKILESIPAECRDSAMIGQALPYEYDVWDNAVTVIPPHDSDNDYYRFDDELEHLIVEYKRPESDDDFAKRHTAYMREAQDSLNQERREYERLKAKFGD